MSFTERAGLFPVLLLTGCAQPVVVTGPPSGSVVDSMLSRSASDISAMQYRLHQSSPSAQRPKSATAPPAAPLLARVSSPSASPGKGSGGSALAPLSGAGPSDGFIRIGGAAPTLRAALRNIVPSGQTVVFDKKVSADAPELWRWTGNDRWPFVINKMLTPRGLRATVNAKTNTITVEPAQKAQSGQSATPPVIPKTIPGKNSPAGAKKSVTESESGKNPFRGNASPGVITTPPATQVKSTAGQLPPLREWKVERGGTLRQGYELWVSQENCKTGKPKWTVRWDTETNYPIDYTLTFRAANFEDATTQLFSLWHSARVPLYVDGFRQQCLVVISDTPPGSSPLASKQE